MSDIKFHQQVVVVVFITLLTGLGVRSVCTQDARFGWGMFVHKTEYEISYYRFEGEQAVKFRPLKGLKGEVARRLTKSSYTWYGIGAVRSWVQAYLNYLSQNEDGVFEAEIQYRINHRDEQGVIRLQSVKPSGQWKNDD